MTARPASEGDVTTVCVFDPTPLLTVTIEAAGDQSDIHFHAGGQGFWVARMATRLGATACLVGSFGGETGNLLRPLVEDSGVRVAGTYGAGRNGSYIQDRRSGARTSVATMTPVPLQRHESDDLYGALIEAATGADITVLTGPSTADVLPEEFYGRLAADLTSLGVRVVADVSGPALRSVVGQHIEALKVSEDDMIRDEFVSDGDDAGRARLLHEWSQDGAIVLWTRADKPALAAVDGELLQVMCPPLQPIDHRGAGDAMTAAVAVSLGRGGSMVDALRLGAAAGAVSVTRHGLASGQPGAVNAVLEQVQVRPWAPDGDES